MQNFKFAISLILTSLVFVQAQAQTQEYNPYKSIGKKKDVVTLTHGKYVEHFDTDSLQRVGSVLINTKTKKVVKLLRENDTTASNVSPSRWLSIDPLASKYPSISPYAFCANNPIMYRDPDGREIRIAYRVQDYATGVFFNRYVSYKNGKLYNEDGSRYKGNGGYVLTVARDIDLLKKDDNELGRRVKVLQNSKEIHTVGLPRYAAEGNVSTPDNEQNVLDHKPTGSSVEYDPRVTKNIQGDKRTPRVGLAHDLLGHSYDYDQGTARSGQTSTGVDYEEVDAVKVENLSRKATGDPQKTTYGKKEIPEADLNAPLQDVKQP